MTSFDPYHRWLGIPPERQPPDYYTLLGVQPLEGDPAVIESAADRQMAHVRTFQNGPHSIHTQTLLSEIAAARVCLLNEAEKTQYDEQLRRRLAPALAANSAEAPSIGVADPRRPLKRPARKDNFVVYLVCGGLGVLLVLSVIAIGIRFQRSLQIVQDLEPPPPAKPPKAASPPPPKAATPKVEQPTTPENPEAPSNEEPAPADAVASWIWIKDYQVELRPHNERAAFRKRFRLDAKPDRALMAITCDNSYRLLINGGDIASDTRWDIIEVLDVADHLIAGENEIIVIGHNRGGEPGLAGLYVDLRMIQPAEVEGIVSDASWECAPVQRPEPPGEGAVWTPVVPVNARIWSRIGPQLAQFAERVRSERE